MQRNRIVAVFLGCVVFFCVGYLLQKPLLQVYWAVHSRIPSHGLSFGSRQSLRFGTGCFRALIPATDLFKILG